MLISIAFKEEKIKNVSNMKILLKNTIYTKCVEFRKLKNFTDAIKMLFVILNKQIYIFVIYNR